MPTSTTSSTHPIKRLALRGDLLDFSGTPAWGDSASNAVRFRADHWLLIEDGRISGAQADIPDASWQQHDHRGHLILPGFIDTHVHSPQLDVIGAFGHGLLDWLDTYTFPAELRYADEAVARQGAVRFLNALLAHGTTSAVVFPTVHKHSVETLFEEAQARGMRLIAGKVLMDASTLAALRDDVAQAERDCVDLIARWHGRDRLAYAVTVRFALSSTPGQLAMAGRLCQAHPGVYMQTHVAETLEEVEAVRQRFPQARSYLDVYDQAGLLHSRSVLAHGIHLDDRDRAVLRDAKAQIAHSPTSNLFLGSGKFDWPQAEAAGLNVSVATDVGGGTSLSMQRTLAAAYKVQALLGHRLTAWKALHAATRGAAEALLLGDEIGSFEAGHTADVCVWKWAAGAVAEHRLGLARDLHDKVFAWMMLGDERNLAAAYVAGRRKV